MSWLETIPLVAGGLIILAALFLAVEAGFRGERRLRPKDGQRRGGLEFLLSAVLGLLALLLGFTFSLSLSRYEARRVLVVQEANAIGTTWLRASLLQEPWRGQITGLLRTYTDTRVRWSEASEDTRDAAATSDLQRRLWGVMGAMIRGETSPVLERGAMEAMNESFDLAAARQAARSARVPEQVLTVLALYSLICMVMLGYIHGLNGQPHRVPTALLLILLSLAWVVILDLDRPRNGAIQVSQQPLIDLRASMH